MTCTLIYCRHDTNLLPYSNLLSLDLKVVLTWVLVVLKVKNLNGRRTPAKPKGCCR